MGFFRTGIAVVLGAGLVFPVEISGVADSATGLLLRAVDSQYRGKYAADVLFVRESFSRGAESLRGRLEFRDQSGERELRLKGEGGAYEWWSRDFGREQWWKEGGERLHRVPFRSLKKPVFSSVLTYEDLTKLPVDYLRDYKSCRLLAETDSTYELQLTLKPAASSRYAAIEATLRKPEILPSRLVFYDPGGRRVKSMEVTGYQAMAGGYWPSGLCVFNGDSLASLRVSLYNPVAGAGEETGVIKSGYHAGPFPIAAGENPEATEGGEQTAN